MSFTLNGRGMDVQMQLCPAPSLPLRNLQLVGVNMLDTPNTHSMILWARQSDPSGAAAGVEECEERFGSFPS